MTTDFALPIKSPGFFGRVRRILLTPLWRPGIKDLYFFCIGLRSCVSSGIPIISAFDIMSRSVRHRWLQKASFGISRDVARGIPIETALRSERKVFSPFFIKVFMGGLKSGSLPHALDILIEHYGWMRELRSVIMSAIWYPVTLLFAGTLIMTGQVLIIHFMHKAFRWREALLIIYFYFRLPLMGLIAAFVLSRVAKKRRVRPVTDAFIVRIPVLGKFHKRYALAIFFRVFAASMEAGREIIGGFRAALEAMDNYYLAHRMQRAEKYLRAGESITEALYLTGVFDTEALSMIHAGEVSGSVPELLRKLAEYYCTAIKNLLPGCIKATYPLLLIVVAIAFFINPYFLCYGVFFMCFLLFLTI